MADISSQLAFEIKQVGAKELSASLVDIQGNLSRVSTATQQYGKETSSLNQLVRQQRQEHRTSNFVFRESYAAITSLYFATQSFSQSTRGAKIEYKAMTEVMNSAFSSSMAAGFAMSAMGVKTGGVTIAIELLIAAGMGLKSFFDNQKQFSKEAADKLRAYAMSARDAREELHALTRERLIKEEGSREAKGDFSFLLKERDTLQARINKAKKPILEEGPFKGLVLGPSLEDIKHVEMLNNQIANARAIYLQKVHEEFARWAPTIKQAEAIFDKQTQFALPDPMKGIFKSRRERADFMGGTMGPIASGDIQLKILQQELPLLKKQEDIEKNLTEQRRIQANLSKLTLTSNERTAQAASQIGGFLGQANSLFFELGGNADTFLGKLLSTAQVLAEIVTLITTLKTALSLFGGGGLPTPMPVGGGTIVSRMADKELTRSIANRISDMARKGQL